jgi:4-hydroxybenzoate polyprenyltransferase
LLTIVIGYILSVAFSGLGTDDAYMSYVNACTNAVLFLAGIVSIWGYLILKELKDKNDDNKNK